ncbi:hypothetical protein BYT27DRAFT_7260382 [Phlegmacium glaucopus]|nr:hypothetical protein BYT27DRAFT_7260382 [Phlegmacium glaucopus]
MFCPNLATTSTTDLNSGDGSESETEDVVLEGMQMNPMELVDVESKSAKATKRGGQPKHPLLDRILQKCYQKPRPDKHIYQCIGGCGTTFTNRNLGHAVCHARGCFSSSAEIQKAAKAHAASCAPSRNLSTDDPESMKDTDVEASKPNRTVVAVKKRRGNEGTVIITQKSSAFFDEAKNLGKREGHQKLDLAIVKLFCVTGVPTHVSDLDMWKGLFSAVDPSYMPASRFKLGEVHTIGQAEEIQALQVAYLGHG